MALSHILRQHQVPYIRVEHSLEIRITCPTCSKYREKSSDPCLSIYKNKQWHCHHCGAHGKEKELLKLLEIHDIYHGGEIMPATETPKSRHTISPLPLEAVPAHTNRHARAYLASRGLSIAQIKQFAFFYCPDGFYKERVIAPVFNRRGEYRTFVSRSIHNHVDKKYLYPKGTPISKLLYNIHFIKQTNKVWIVEGIFDSLHCFPYAVASFGKHISQEQIDMLRTHGITRTYLLWDAESWQNTPHLWDVAVKKLRKYFFTYPVKLADDTPTEYTLKDLQHLCGERV